MNIESKLMIRGRTEYIGMSKKWQMHPNMVQFVYEVNQSGFYFGNNIDASRRCSESYIGLGPERKFCI